jgi:hypothetical protein
MAASVGAAGAHRPTGHSAVRSRVERLPETPGAAGVVPAWL